VVIPHRNRERFPRSAYARRIGNVMDELRAWQRAYTRRAEFTDSPALESKLRERAACCDEVWHLLMDASTSLRFMS
jgi:hypothetical protein